jgi:hypothetical protein
MNLHANAGNGSASTALNMVFGDSAPSASAFSQMRKKVSFKYFESVFNRTAATFCENLRPTHKGYYLTSVDGDQYLIERTQDALSLGFKGQKCGSSVETFGLKIYLTLATCMISGAPLAITTSTNQNELVSGIETTEKVATNHGLILRNKTEPEKQIFCYDRLYFGRALIDLHRNLGTYFVARCKTGGTFSEVKEFVKSNQELAVIELFGMKIRLIKARHKDSDFYYATNNFDKNIDNEAISWIYLRRWQSETTNSHAAKILGIERFHTRKINGILQEIYSSFWALLISKSNKVNVKQTREDFDKKSYRRQNCKEVLGTLTKNTKLLIEGIEDEIFNRIELTAKNTTRLVNRLSRSYPRIRKYQRQKKYPQQKPIEISTS